MRALSIISSAALAAILPLADRGEPVLCANPIRAIRVIRGQSSVEIRGRNAFQPAAMSLLKNSDDADFFNHG